jgi:hypothetical protein
MAELPLLVLPDPTAASKARRGGGGAPPPRLTPARQQQRLGPSLDRLEATFEAKRLSLQVSTTGLIPEEVLVLETVGSIEDRSRRRRGPPANQQSQSDSRRPR